MSRSHLSRRQVLAGVFTLPLSLPASAGLPHEVRFVHGGFDGATYQGGLLVRMSTGWKTYWRVPGAGGIPPDISVTGNNVAGLRFDCPLPQRFPGEEGETIGYKDEVVFPWSLTPIDPAAPLRADFKAFVGICETMCIPVPVQETVELKPLAMVARDSALLLQWRARVPASVTPGPVLTASVAEEGGQIFLDLTLDRAARDVFVEGNALHYYSRPEWHADGRQARLSVRGAKSANAVQGSTLRLTLDTSGQGLEQYVNVS